MYDSSKEFTSEAKEYDRFIFKIIKVIVKQTLFKENWG